ncbi:nucleotide exchange factors-like protein [Obba rivulosa]|uniref:Nucleotide exchange factors-like protein n=1 Tax=Obba rivulosa TaxID=1052685 RepID=A0A8E2B2R2_9APHY|nr:nucleotide exchange factors-like protein [Obba rivulosa]
MENLLRWSIQNSTDNNPQPNNGPAQNKDLDPGILDAILGRPDSELMKEALAVAVDEKRREDERIQALDDFEMLIEHIDNANNMEKLQMWEPLQALLTSPSSTDDIKTQTLWIIGTAVQNNPAAQFHYLSFSPVSTLLSFLSPSVRSAKTRSKAVYALSSVLKHSAAAVRQLEEAGGWETLKAALEDSDISVRRKTAFLFNSLLAPSYGVDSAGEAQLSGPTLHSETTEQPAASPTVHPNSHASMLSDPSSFVTSPATAKAFEAHGIADAMISSLTSPTPHGPDGEQEGDADFEEKAIRSLHTYLTSCQGRLPENQKRELRQFIQDQAAKEGGDEKLADRWGMMADEVKELSGAVA